MQRLLSNYVLVQPVDMKTIAETPCPQYDGQPDGPSQAVTPCDRKLSDPPQTSLHALRAVVATMTRQSGGGKRGKRGKGRVSARRMGFGPVLGSNHFSYTSDGVYTFTNRTMQQNAISSNASGIISYSINLNPSVPTNWSAQTNLFDEARIHAIRVTLIPHQTASVGLAIAIDDDNAVAAAPSSVDVVMQYGNCWFGSVVSPPGCIQNGGKVKAYEYTCAPASQAIVPNDVVSSVPLVPLGAWGDVGSYATGSLGFLLIRADNCIVSTTYFDYVFEFVMQYRQTR